MNKDKIKESFRKVKNDIFSLGEEVNSLRTELKDLKSEIGKISEFIDQLKIERKRKNTNFNKNTSKNTKNYQNSPNLSVEDDSTHNSTHSTHNSTLRHKNSTHPRHSTHRTSLEDLRTKNIRVSTRNQGVPTDRQTDRQTDTRHINRPNFNTRELQKDPNSNNKLPQNIDDLDYENIDDLEKARDILDNLDSLKKDLRRKFKKLTDQEVKVFSLIYQLDQQDKKVNYKVLSEKMGLSEGSIRDYVSNIIKKGISLKKEKLNNKRVVLHISNDLKEITSLDTLLQLREL